MPKNSAKSTQPGNTPRLYRSKTDRVIAGIAGGLGGYFHIDPTIIRLVFVLITIFGGSGILIYLILWLIIPNENANTDTEDTLRENAQEMRLRASELTQNLRIEKGQTDTKFWLAIIIIAFGLMFLLNNFGLTIGIGRLWPLVLVILGLFILLRKS